MPTSHPESRRWVAERVAELSPDTMLDVGAGAGTYADLLRPYVRHIEAVEIFRPYLTRFRLHAKYEQVHVGDVRTWQWPRRYGLVVCGDVLEHMAEDEAVDVHRQALDHADAVLVVLPIVHWPQDGRDGNQHEAHVSDWDHEKASAAFAPDVWWTGEYVGAYLTRSGR